ncbi:hypothetical protein [Sphingomonas sp. NFR15]|uniref:hypothetical protein n=1 Tax=Sphingomonas sp. NFR15 TaxID=1566282 RepID=UPI000882619E|nr:hypothetical protein [Sphingomonas sp. NFR15]SDA36262.1 hypothetical protein SAMN03159340_03592 [Sphingomonas sp. NFR15]
MRDQIDKLGVLLRLRRREVDRRAREAAIAAAAVQAAEAARAEAERFAVAARVKRDRALTERLAAPADAHIAAFCLSCEQRVHEAIEALRRAERAIAGAVERATAIRQHLRRAEARLEALATQLHQAVARQRQAGERRAADDRVVPGALAWA